MTTHHAPPQPWPVRYALARHYLGARRDYAANRSRPRSDAYRSAAGALNALGHFAFDAGMARHVGIAGIARKTLDEYPIQPGPDWLHQAAEDLAARLEAPR